MSITFSRGKLAAVPSGTSLAVLSVISAAPINAHAADGANACGARLQGTFVESAPRDRFEFEHLSTEGWTVARLALELDGSATASAASGAFAAGESFVFSIDVDDSLDDSALGQIRVAGAEIEGGRLSVDFVHGDGVTERLSGYFDANARVELVGTPCPG